MLMNAYQPKGLDEEGQIISQLTPEGAKYNIWKDFNEMLIRYQNSFKTRLAFPMQDNATVYRALVSLYTGGAIYDAFISVRGYKNVLVIPSWTDASRHDLSTFASLVFGQEDSYLPYGGAGIHSFPIIHQYNETDGKITVVKNRNHVSFFDFLYEQYASVTGSPITIARADEPYVLGKDDYLIKGHIADQEKYDAVILMDVPHFENETYRSSEIKKDFQHLCTEGYELVQFNTTPKLGERIIGRKDILDTIQKVIGIITPDNLKKEPLEIFDDEEGVIRTTQENSFKLQVSNLLHKIRVH